MSDKKTRITIRMSDEILWKMRAEMVSRRIAAENTAIEEAVTGWASGAHEQNAGFLEKSSVLSKNVSAQEKRWVDKLLAVLRSGNPRAISAVTENLNVFEEFCDISHAKPSSGTPTSQPTETGKRPESARQPHPKPPESLPPGKRNHHQGSDPP